MVANTKERFEKHHAANPEVYEMFKKYAFRAANKKTRYSARTIFHRIRWHTEIEENDSRFKISNNWISHYSRKFMNEYPQHKGFFSIRNQVNSCHTDSN